MTDYKWQDLRNAVGFAAECARLALPFYEGDRRADVLRAIEVAEAYSRGEDIDPNAADAYAAAYAAHAAASAAAGDAAAAASAAAYAAHAAAAAYAAAAAAAAHVAAEAGVSPNEIELARCRWIVRDLGGDPQTEVGRAAVVALIAHHLETAKDILGRSDSTGRGATAL